MNSAQRSALRKAITAHSDWRAWSLRNRLKIESMSVAELLRAANELGIDVTAIIASPPLKPAQAKPRLKLLANGGILVFSPNGRWEAYERQA